MCACVRTTQNPSLAPPDLLIGGPSRQRPARKCAIGIFFLFLSLISQASHHREMTTMKTTMVMMTVAPRKSFWVHSPIIFFFFLTFTRNLKSNMVDPGAFWFIIWQNICSFSIVIFFVLLQCYVSPPHVLE